MRIKGVSINTFHTHEKLSPLSDIVLVFKKYCYTSSKPIYKRHKCENILYS